MLYLLELDNLYGRVALNNPRLSTVNPAFLDVFPGIADIVSDLSTAVKADVMRLGLG